MPWTSLGSLDIDRWNLVLKRFEHPQPATDVKGGASGGELRCSRCGQSGHVEKECLRAPAEPSISVEGLG